MRIDSEITDGLCRLQVEGGLTIYSVPELKLQLLDRLEKASQLQVDLSRVNEIDTAGFQVLYLAKREALRMRKPLRLVSCSPTVQELLRLYHATAYFEELAEDSPAQGPVTPRRRAKTEQRP